MNFIEKYMNALKKLGLRLEVNETETQLNVTLIALNSRSFVNMGKARKEMPNEWNGKKVVVETKGC
jgi:hypothetical protein